MFTYKNIHKLNKCKYLLAILTRVIYNSIVSSQNPDQAETVCLLKTKLRRQLNHEKQKGIIHRTNRVNCSNVCRFDLRTKPAFAGHNICCRTIQSFRGAECACAVHTRCNTRAYNRMCAFKHCKHRCRSAARYDFRLACNARCNTLHLSFEECQNQDISPAFNAYAGYIQRRNRRMGD